MARKRTAPYKVAHKFGLNLRAEPSKEAEVLRVLPFGETVEPEPDAEAPEGWLAVKGGGYVMTEYLK